MDVLYFKRLVERDLLESRFGELFSDANELNESKAMGDDLSNEELTSMKFTLKTKDNEIKRLREVINVMSSNNKRMSDDLIGANIENTVLQEKLDSLTQEHNELVKRWLQKVQNDVETMNATIESHGNR
ncbi:hypothetical protein KAFR_0B04910 [Kazachstania africana CBS 2517]|uniref:Autophagy-related protein 16 domain-containing protein n=1 Tax=Kazachstania africana (strain ATCC 22294 / BCRC 22015 / CBS 2517 / CECT 1963 / NBRC 1671 / NRRL Y-8276) TaxID=1071382 RepID=H2AQY7_KAZAF|nr:hypothetical protein KAFR_0B04910 [Kazachstania africana CBS 2517]CCF56787.1 hypothetical protein KAFR_0B04910 [Kazachstania africana CBS 2517]